MGAGRPARNNGPFHGPFPGMERTKTKNNKCKKQSRKRKTTEQETQNNTKTVKKSKRNVYRLPTPSRAQGLHTDTCGAWWASPWGAPTPQGSWGFSIERPKKKELDVRSLRNSVTFMIDGPSKRSDAIIMIIIDGMGSGWYGTPRRAGRSRSDNSCKGARRGTGGLQPL